MPPPTTAAVRTSPGPAVGCLFVFCVPFLLGSAWLVHLRLDELQTRRAIAHRAAGWQGSPDGPVVLRGVLRAAEVPPLPTGHPAALWAYSVSRHESRHDRQICSHTSVESTQAPRLEVEGQTLPLGGFLGVDQRPVGLRWPRLSWLAPDGSVSVHVAGWPARGETLPDGLPADCQGPGGTYREGLLADGAEVRVLGCKRGDRLLRCEDGVDAITTLDRPTFAASTASNTRPLGVSTAFSLISWFLLSALLLASLPASPWRPREISQGHRR
jgi:hypothetical protein